MATGKKYFENALKSYPKDWQVKPLGEIGAFSKGKGILKEQVIDSGIPCIRYGEIYTRHEYEVKKFYSFVNSEVAGESQQIKRNSVLFAGSGEKLEEIGKAVAFNKEEKAYAGGDVIILSLNGKVEASYLSYLLNSDIANWQKRRLGQGHSVVHIYPSDLADLHIPIAPLSQQQKIVSVLNTWDMAIELNEKLVVAKEKQKRALVQQLLTGRKRFKEFRKEKWKERCLGEVAKFNNGKAFKQDELLEIGKYRVLRVGNFFTNSNWYYSDLELEEDKYVSTGDLMYAWSASFGPRYWTKEKTIYHYHIWKVIPSSLIRKDFLFSFLQYDAERLINNKQGGTMFHITKGDMEKRMISLPSLDEQKAIAFVLSASDNEIRLLMEKLKALKKGKRGLMQDLLTGKKSMKL